LQYPQARTRVTGKLLANGNDHRANIRVRVGVLQLQTLGDHFHITLRPFASDAGLHPRDNFQVVTVTPGEIFG